jgi:hypothetical protein
MAEEMTLPRSLRPGSPFVRYLLTVLSVGGALLSFGTVLFTPAEYHDYVALATGLMFLIFFVLPMTILAYLWGGFSKWQKK